MHLVLRGPQFSFAVCCEGKAGGEQRAMELCILLYQVPWEGVPHSCLLTNKYLTSWHNNSIVTMCCFLLVCKYARVALISKNPTLKWFHFDFEKSKCSWTALIYSICFCQMLLLKGAGEGRARTNRHHRSLPRVIIRQSTIEILHNSGTYIKENVLNKLIDRAYIRDLPKYPTFSWITAQETQKYSQTEVSSSEICK